MEHTLSARMRQARSHFVVRRALQRMKRLELPPDEEAEIVRGVAGDDLAMRIVNDAPLALHLGHGALP